MRFHTNDFYIIFEYFKVCVYACITHISVCVWWHWRCRWHIISLCPVCFNMIICCEKLDIKRHSLQKLVFVWPEITNTMSSKQPSSLSAWLKVCKCLLHQWKNMPNSVLPLSEREGEWLGCGGELIYPGYKIVIQLQYSQISLRIRISVHSTDF